MSLFISIFGPDGSGKSTQVRILARHILSNGYRVRIVWIKSYHTLAYVLSKLIEKLSPNSIVRNAYGHIIRINTLCNTKFSRALWSLIEFVSLIPLIILRVYIPLLMGEIVIAERYVIDSIASIAYAVNDPLFDSRSLAEVILSFIPKKRLLIYLDCDYKTVKTRRLDLTDPEDFFKFQHEIYDRLSKRLGAIKINTAEKSISETAHMLRFIVDKKFPLSTNQNPDC
ncbi:hypothetical protein DRN63_02840 [Nanoarchaeota archaeon]|mgnify:CR=1 FL=1|nr:MAG: hypothetical protein DRN63_02840 [Nanoarchaeota archaeon]